MERLTTRHNGVAVIRDKSKHKEAMEKLATYEELEGQGLLLKIPCKVGDTIYKIPSKVNHDLNIMHGYSELNRVYEQVVYSIELFSNDRYFIGTCDGTNGVVSEHYKETWFLTKAEAEKVLAEMGK